MHSLGIHASPQRTEKSELSGQRKTISKGKVNRIQVIFNAEHKPYLYGAIHIVDGGVDNQWSEGPFVISKRGAAGETSYGTVARTITKVWSQLERLDKFRSDADRRLNAAGIRAVDHAGSQLPESNLADQILDEQEDVIEEVLLCISVYVRVLSGIFPKKLSKAKVNVYDYDGSRIDNIELSEIANLLLHQRYILIRNEYVVDLITDERFMSDRPQLGLKISFPEYVAQVERTLNELTVGDLVGKLWGATKRLSSSSNIKDIVFLTQNLYTLGGLVVEDGAPIVGGPLKPILDRVAAQVAKRSRAGRRRKAVEVRLAFRTPRFYLEPDLNDKRIRVSVEVNGTREELVLGYEDFFSEVSKAHGNMRLRSSPQRGR